MAVRAPYRALGERERAELAAVGRLLAQGLPWQAAWELTAEQAHAVLDGMTAARATGGA